MERPTLESIFMKFAHDLAQRSTCGRLKVGAVVASPDFREIYAIGVNGGPVGGFNECLSDEPGKCGHFHAEMNACNFAQARVPKVLFCTHAPCMNCAIGLVNKLGFAKVYYGQAYRSTAGLDVLKAAGIETIQLEVR